MEEILIYIKWGKMYYVSKSRFFVYLVQFFSAKDTSYQDKETDKSGNLVEKERVVTCIYRPFDHYANHGQGNWYTQKPVPYSCEVHIIPPSIYVFALF